MSAAEKWTLWPTAWAGGNPSTNIRGVNVPWIESSRGGVICLLNPINGNITEAVYKRGALIARAPELLEENERLRLENAEQAETIERLTQYIDYITEGQTIG